MLIDRGFYLDPGASGIHCCWSVIMSKLSQRRAQKHSFLFKKMCLYRYLYFYLG